MGAEQVLRTLTGFKEYATGTLLVLELVGTLEFVLSGATAGVKHRLDLFGVLVVSFATATAGGIRRDLLIGAIPPDSATGNLMPSGTATPASHPKQRKLGLYATKSLMKGDDSE